ncbi:MAG: hypothetical protein V2A34_01750 [Lentisphaerota bacterium]
MGIPFPLPRQMSLGLGVEDEFSQYNFAQVEDPLLKDLFDAIQVARATLNYRPHPGLQLQVYGGTLVWQEFKLIDSDGNPVSVTKTDPVPLLGASGTIRF